MKILITGCAGFIGFHISLKFLNAGYKVVGVDNINSYYKKKLKKDRLEFLKKKFPKSFFFHLANIENYKKMQSIFNASKPNTVIHLAAQAGVRYSIQNPSVYIKTNINGFFNIIELSRLLNVKKFFYASSSSVYGNNKKYPLSESFVSDKPLSLYAASKKSNELIAESYYNIFKFKSVGLRFFTVYGPFGRPDMIMYKLFDSIYFNKNISIYNRGDHYRDFTFVDDVTEYVYRLFSKFSNLRIQNEVYNIGCGNSVSLKKIIKLIENITEKKLKYKLVKMQLGDVRKTHSDTSKLIRITNYKPLYNYVSGINILHTWFKNYHKL